MGVSLNSVLDISRSLGGIMKTEVWPKSSSSRLVISVVPLFLSNHTNEDSIKT